MTELKISDKNTKIVLRSVKVPYGAKLFFAEGEEVKKGQTLFEFDPFNALIISEVSVRSSSITSSKALPTASSLTKLRV